MYFSLPPTTISLVSSPEKMTHEKCLCAFGIKTRRSRLTNTFGEWCFFFMTFHANGTTQRDVIRNSHEICRVLKRLTLECPIKNSNDHYLAFFCPFVCHLIHIWEK